MSVTKNPGRNILGTNGTTDWGSVGVKKQNFRFRLSKNLLQNAQQMQKHCQRHRVLIQQLELTEDLKKVFVFSWDFVPTGQMPSIVIIMIIVITQI